MSPPYYAISLKEKHRDQRLTCNFPSDTLADKIFDLGTVKIFDLLSEKRQASPMPRGKHFKKNGFLQSV